MIAPDAPAGDHPKTPVPAAGQPKPAVPTLLRTVPAPAGPAALDSQELTRRVVGALEGRPVSATLPVKVRSFGGTVTLSGKVPTAYEAMVVYRAVQQTPGVDDIVDMLEFTVPDENNANPLVRLGRPEDVEPYLAAQIRRHVGELARLEGIRRAAIGSSSAASCSTPPMASACWQPYGRFPSSTASVWIPSSRPNRLGQHFPRFDHATDARTAKPSGNECHRHLLIGGAISIGVRKMGKL